ncbi:MAG: hypothetical protein LCH54_10105 [Bacteroidetes bacterium]|nr:hypothetical protein [Bacteroidota bacterium]
MKSNIFPGWGLLFLSALILFGINPAYSANLTNVSVTLSNAQASATGVTYTITLNSDAAILKSENIRIVFPTGTGLGSVTAAGITVNGVTSYGGGGTAFNVTTNTLIIDHQANSGNDLPAGSWTIVVSNVTNSATVSSTHTVNIDAPTPATAATSAAFTITSATAVSFVGGAATPSISSLVASAVTQYSISPTLIAHAVGDRITVTFPSGTVLPSTISPSDVTINSVAASAVSVDVSNRKATLTIGTGFSGAAIPIIFTASAGIANPSTTGATSTGISVSTNLQPTSGTTNTYLITGASNLTAANVTLSPTTVNTVSQNSIAFNVGSLGALTASTDSVIVTFPAGTLVPSSISTSAVTINGVAPASVNTNVSLRRIRMKIGSSGVSAGEGVSVVFTSSAGIQSPASAGSYTLSVRTNKESEVTSNSYSITASTLSTPTVSLGTPNPSVASTYTFGFSVGAAGAMTANSSTFTVTFPTGTTLNPATLSASTISVNGTAVTVSPTVNAGSRTVQFTTPVDISDNGAVSLVFSTGITNPAAVGSYTASIQSSIETTNLTSQSYSIQNTTAVTGFSVARSGTSYTIIKSTTLTYTFTFTTSASGALSKGQFISFYFPSGFNLAGAAVSASTGFTTSQATAALNISGTTVTMTIAGGPASQLAANTQGTLTFTGITNSSSARTDNVIGITTSGDGTLVNTAAFVLFDDTQISGVSVTPNPSTVNTTAAYSFSFTNANETTLKGARDTVYVTFPAGTTIPASIPNDAVKVNGISAYSVSKSGQTVYVVIPGDIAASASVTVNFSVDAGIISNTTLTSQNATVKVSATTTPQNAAFTLTALTTISTPTVTPSTLIKSSTDVQYTISFSTNNALSTSDSIVVVFPTGMLPNNSTAQTRYTSVKVNGSYLTLGTQLKVYGDNTTLALKTPVAVSGNTTTTLILETGFGITNPASANSYTLDARTTQDVTPVTSNSFTITNSTVTGVTVSVSPSTISTTGDYTFAFTTGAGGALSGGSGKIYLIFPYETTLPASIAPGNVTINSVAASAVQVSKVNTTNQDTVIVTITNSIGNGASVSVNLTTSAAITNPATAGSSYQAKVYTDSEPTAVPSASYTISAANAVTNVLLKYQSSQVASATNVVDSVQFVQPGASVVAGNLIYVTFPSGYTL